MSDRISKLLNLYLSSQLHVVKVKKFNNNINMSLSSLFILDMNGTVLISRDYRGDINKDAIENFIPLLNKKEEEGVFSPVLHQNGITFTYIKHNGLYVIGTTKKNANIALIFTFMYKIIQTLSHYFNKLEEESIKDNFVLIYELLDEIMDFGYPQTTDSKILQTYIFQESYKLKNSIPSVVTNVVSWRPEGIKYRRNELFIDVIESVNLSVNPKGAILKNEVSGCVKMKVHLSGMPQLRLGLSDKILLAINSYGLGQDSINFEDVKFHQCVQLSRIPEKNIYFIPPDGDFELMSYRLNSDIKPLISIETKVTKNSYSTIEYDVKASAHFRSTSTANNVEIILPVCQDVDTPFFKNTMGMAYYAPEKSAVLWKIKYFPGGAVYSLNIKFKLSTIRSEDKQGKTPVQVKFIIPYFTISGLQIKFLKVIEKSNYKALTWVRYTTQNGEYLISFNN